MLATLYVILCAASSCHQEVVTEMPFGACVTMAGQQRATEYAEERKLTFKSWKCEVGRRA